MIKILLFTILAGLTLFCYTFIEQYKKSGPNILTDSWQVQVQNGGRAEIKETGLLLVSLKQRRSINIKQEIISFKPESVLKLSADMKSKNVQPGENPWNKPRLILVQHDGQKDRWDFPHLVASFSSDTGWNNYYEFFVIRPETKQICVNAQLSQCAGIFQLKNIQLFPMNQTQIFTWVKKSILTSWGIFSIFLMGPLFLKWRDSILLKSAFLIVFIVIIAGATLPGDMKNQVSNKVKSQILTSSNLIKDNNTQWDISKAGHFCFFTVFGLVLSLLMSREAISPILINILLLAGGTEMAQFYIDGRTPLIWDFIIDIAGGLSGFLLIRFSGIRKPMRLTPYNKTTPS